MLERGLRWVGKLIARGFRVAPGTEQWGFSKAHKQLDVATKVFGLLGTLLLCVWGVVEFAGIQRVGRLGNAIGHLRFVFSVGVVFLWGASGAMKALRKNPLEQWIDAMTKHAQGRLEDWLVKASGECDVSLFCEFATEGAIETIAKMNFDAFSGSSFDASYDSFYKRNLGYIKKNNKSFMFIKDPISGKYAGYTCMLPLNAGGKALYLGDGIKDTAIPSELIAGNNEEAACVLVFAICLVDEFRVGGGDGASLQYVNLLKRAIANHVNVINYECNNGNGVRLYAQAEYRSMLRHIQRVGFVDSGIVSGDGFKLYTAWYDGRVISAT